MLAGFAVSTLLDNSKACRSSEALSGTVSCLIIGRVMVVSRAYASAHLPHRQSHQSRNLPAVAAPTLWSPEGLLQVACRAISQDRSRPATRVRTHRWHRLERQTPQIFPFPAAVSLYRCLIPEKEYRRYLWDPRTLMRIGQVGLAATWTQRALDD